MGAGGGGSPSELSHLYHSYDGSSIVTYYIYVTRPGLVAAALARHVISRHMEGKCGSSVEEKQQRKDGCWLRTVSSVSTPRCYGMEGGGEQQKS